MTIHRLYKTDGGLIFEHECESIRECVEEAVRQDINLTDVDLYGEDLSNISIYNARMPGAALTNARLEGANIIECNLALGIFVHTDLRNSICSLTDFSGSKFEKTCFLNACLHGADMTDTDRSACNTEGAALFGSIGWTGEDGE